MNEEKRKRLDESHPDCAEYARKFKAIWGAYFKFEEVERAKYPDWHGLDHPADKVVIPARRECCKQIKELQKEYAYLFVEEGQ